MTSNRLLTVLKLAVSLGLIALALSHVDLRSAVVRVAGLDLWALGAAIGLAVIVLFIGAARWQAVQYAIGAPISLRDACRLYYVGSFFNQTLPSSVGGDPVRMYLARQAGLPTSKAVTGVVLERVMTIIGLVIVVDLAAPAFIGMMPRDAMLVQVLVPGLVLGTIGMVLFCAAVVFLNLMPESLRRFSVFRGVQHLGADARSLLRHPFVSGYALALGAANSVLLSLITYVLANGLGESVSFFDCLVLVPPVLLVTTLPITVAGWGVRETAMMAAFGIVGMPGDASVSMSLIIGFIFLILSLPGGMFWLKVDDRRRQTGQRLAAGPTPLSDRV